MKKCVFCGAKSGTNATETFHMFPSDKLLAQLWVKAMKWENWTPQKWVYLCSKHFEEDCFETRYSIKEPGKCFKVLRKGSIPSLFGRDETPDVPSTSSDVSIETPLKKIKLAQCASDKENEVPHSTDNECEIITENMPSTSSTVNEECTYLTSTECRVRGTENDHRYCGTPQSLKKKVSALSKLLEAVKKENKRYREHNKYLKKRVNSLKEAISDLKKKFHSSGNA